MKYFSNANRKQLPLEDKTFLREDKILMLVAKVDLRLASHGIAPKVRHEKDRSKKQKKRVEYFQELLKLTHEANPGLTNTAARKMTMEIIQKLSTDLATFIMQVDPGRRKRYELAREEYLASKKAEALTEGSGPIVQPSGQILRGEKAHMLQWASKMTDNSDRYFCCRQKNCRFFGLNIHWIDTTESGGWQFLCPICVCQFRVGACGIHLTPAHFLWVTDGPAGPQYILAEWPAAAEENFMCKMLEIANQSITEEMRLMKPSEVQDLLTLKMHKESRRAYFSEIPFTKAAEVDAENAKRTKKKPWSYKRIEERGNYVTGAFYDPDTPVMSQEDATKLLALQLLLVDGMTDELEKAARPKL